MTKKQAGFTFDNIKQLVDKPSLKSQIKSRDIEGHIRDMMKYYTNAVVIYLYDTPIITYDIEEDRLIVNSGGYRTITTCSRINKVIGILGFAVYLKDKEWYISNFNLKMTEPFYDGYTIEQPFELLKFRQGSS